MTGIALVCAGTAGAANCPNTSVGLVPIDDLGPGNYLGSQGGLYPGGVNARPPGHDAAGLALANAIEPIDGKIVMISFGMSNTTQEFSQFVPLATDFPGRNPDLQIIDTAKSGVDAVAMANPDHAYWDFVHERLALNGATAEQVRVAWLKQAVAGPTDPFPGEELVLKDRIRTILQIAKDHFPNLELVYLSSRIYAGYATTALNPEPWAYGSAFADKWLIEDQIAGTDPGLNYDPDAGPVEAPWIAWGPYLWANGLVPRSDGLVWRCQDFLDDGTHPSLSGRLKVARRLLEFFTTDGTATPWFLGQSVSVDEGVAPGSPGGAPYPNPFRTSLSVPFELASPREVQLDVFDVSGRRIWGVAPGRMTGGTHVVTWDGRDAFGRKAAAGVYLIRIRAGRAEILHRAARTR